MWIYMKKILNIKGDKRMIWIFGNRVIVKYWKRRINWWSWGGLVLLNIRVGSVVE